MAGRRPANWWVSLLEFLLLDCAYIMIVLVPLGICRRWTWPFIIGQYLLAIYLLATVVMVDLVGASPVFTLGILAIQICFFVLSIIFTARGGEGRV